MTANGASFTCTPQTQATSVPNCPSGQVLTSNGSGGFSCTNNVSNLQYICGHLAGDNGGGGSVGGGVGFSTRYDPSGLWQGGVTGGPTEGCIISIPLTLPNNT